MQFKIATKDLSKFSAMNIVCDGDAVTLSFDDSLASEHIVDTVCKAPLAMPLKDLDHLSWGEIDQIGLSGKAREVFALGAQKKDHMKNGFVAVWQIIGFNHDDLADGTGKAPLSWDMVRVYNEDWSWNDESTNRGGYEASVVRRRLDTEFFSLCSDELQAIIKPVIKLTSAGDCSKEIIKSICKIWLKSEKELYGRCFYSMPGEGHWYEYYKQEDVPYYKEDDDGNRRCNLLRSPYYSVYSNFFCFVYTSGFANSYYARFSFGLAPAFSS